MTEHHLHDYIAGAVGGTAGLVVGHPFDTTKVQLQIQHHGKQYSGTLDAIKHIHKFGWVQGFFRGLSWPVLSYGVVNSVFFGVYGNTLKFLEKDRTKRKSSYLNLYLAGCVGGTAQILIAIPVDYIKVVLQSQIPHDLGASNSMKLYKGPIECVAAVVKERGIVGMYKGGVAMAVREIPSYGIYCLTYEVLNVKMHEKRLTDSKGIIASLLAGGVAGSVTWFSILPVDVIKSRYQADCNGEYKGFLDCAYKCYQEGGIRIFYRGCLVTCARAFLVNAVTFLAYSQTLKYLETKRVHKNGTLNPNEM
ncbi:hypothetical protein CHS0354_029414 [Potamilus streckersoni]|uniref:Mitochondrial carrier protein n=1 Tax=Potamilus streckersoni TaxID=2493646 RepID=A0AAE0STV2_9BIVA|nr:hypothetical protein CHS0354_029414 [Potamilus streckersoni]